MQQGLSEPEFYGDLVYKLGKIASRADFSDTLRKDIIRYKCMGYNIHVMRQSACLAINPFTVESFASLFNCTPVGCASLSYEHNTKKLVELFKSCLLQGNSGFNWWFSFALGFQ